MPDVGLAWIVRCGLAILLTALLAFTIAIVVIHSIAYGDLSGNRQELLDQLEEAPSKVTG